MDDVKYEYGCEVTSTKECPLREEIRAEVINDLVALVNSDGFKMRCIMSKLPFFEFVANEFGQVIKEQRNE